jgi:hypothetical protein
MRFFEKPKPFSADGMDETLCSGCGLSRTDRFMACGAMFLIGWLMSWLAFINLLTPSVFAIFYTFGNILSLSSLCFLSGPCNQLKNMFKQKRILATTIYLVMMILTLVCAFKGQPAIVVFIFAFLQFLAMCWYTITYIPYGQTMLKNCLAGMC